MVRRVFTRHRHQEFIRFLNTIEAQVAKRKAIHAIVDNYATHKHPRCAHGLPGIPRWTFHFTPTSDWFNARRLNALAFRPVDELKAAINCFIVDTNAEPCTFIWTADPRRVLAAVKRGKQALELVHESGSWID